MKKAAKGTAIVLLVLTGINALIAGFLFILDPSGHTMGLTTAYLQYAPFKNFLIPGIILFLINGILNIIAAVAVIKKSKYAHRLILLQGILLCGWIGVQIVLVKDINPLHISMFSIGLLLIICSRLLKGY